jgi:hypothetical protein
LGKEKQKKKRKKEIGLRKKVARNPGPSTRKVMVNITLQGCLAPKYQSNMFLLKGPFCTSGQDSVKHVVLRTKCIFLLLLLHLFFLHCSSASLLLFIMGGLGDKEGRRGSFEIRRKSSNYEYRES